MPVERPVYRGDVRRPPRPNAVLTIAVRHARSRGLGNAIGSALNLVDVADRREFRPVRSVI